MTVNELMVLMKVVRERKSDLANLREQVSTRERRFHIDANREIEPMYSVQEVDKKVVELQNFLFQADSVIKQANAKTTVDIEYNADSLLAPLK